MTANLLKFITDELTDIGENQMGQKFAIPPKTGMMIEERRRLKNKLVSLSEKFVDKHTGWQGFATNVTIDDLTTRLMLCEELADAWGYPMSFMMCFDFAIFSEPSRMYVINRGLLPLVWKQRSTPHLLRVAWDGAYADLWDVEDVLTLPAPIEPVNPENAPMPMEIGAWFAGAE